MTSNENKIIAWAESQVGAGYVWGAGGYKLTKSKLQELIAQYPQYVSESKNSKWLGHQVWDCASLVRYAMKQIGISMVSGATSQWKKTKWARKGTIDQLPKDQVACLYRWTGSVMQHTGIYLGNGYVIDARGSGAGVVKSKLSSYPWTHFGQPQGLIKKEQTNEVISVSIKQKQQQIAAQQFVCVLLLLKRQVFLPPLLLGQLLMLLKKQKVGAVLYITDRKAI